MIFYALNILLAFAIGLVLGYLFRQMRDDLEAMKYEVWERRKAEKVPKPVGKLVEPADDIVTSTINEFEEMSERLNRR